MSDDESVRPRPRYEARWLTVKEAADYTRTDPDWILAHIKSGALRYVPTARRTVDNARGPRRRIVDRFKLDALMERLEVMDVVRPPESERDEEPSAPRPNPRPNPKAIHPSGMSTREMLKRGL